MKRTMKRTGRIARVSKEELIEAAQLLKDFCDSSDCKDCPFSDSVAFYHTCRVQDGIPQEWDLAKFKEADNGKDGL